METLTREYETAMYRFVYNCFSMCIYALLFGAIIYIGDFGLTTDKHFALSLILGFFAGLLNEINRKIEFFNRDMLEEIKKADQVETAMEDLERVETVMEDLGKKIKAFSEMHKGKSADDILAEMRGEENLAWSEEDEKIRKEIIKIVKKDEERIGVNAHLKKIQWLEKQGKGINGNEREIPKKEIQEEPTSEDLEQAAIDYDSCRPALYGEDDEGDYVEYIEVRKGAFIAGAKWQFERVKELLLSEVLPCFMNGGEADEIVAKLEEVLHKE